ncbi:hypothetical protein [Humidesulfovibrio sp.]
MNLKERLTSTEKLLRSIRSGEALSSQAQQEPARAPEGSIWTRPISFGNIFSGLRRRTATQAAAPTTQNAAPAPTSAAPAPAAAPVSAPAAPGSPPPAAVAPAAAAPAEGTGSDSLWTRPLTLPVGPGRAKTQAAAKPFWTRQIHFGGNGKTHSIGISVSGPSLCLAVVRQASGSLEAARRFPMEAEQAPGEKGFPAFLNACLEALGHARTSADLWAVLRSSDLDLNVLAVPKLSGAKLDAAAYWTLQKEKKFAEAEYALDYLVFGPTAESKEPRLDILTCLARRSDVERLRDAFRDAGHPLTGVTAIPNALLALYRRPGAPTGHAMAANIHVEPDFSAIGLYTKDRLLFSRFIRSGAGSMAETLAEHFQAQAQARSKPAALADLELPLPGGAEQRETEPAARPQALDAAQAHELMRHVLLGAPRPAFATPEQLLSPEEMLEVLSPAIERLARQVERTLEYYATSQQGRCDALHLSGEIFGCPAIAQALAGQLGFPPVVFDAAAMLQATPAQVPPADSLTLTPAIAAALAKADKGVNLIANYKVRTAQEAKRLVTRSIILGLAGVMVLIGAAGVVLEQANAVKQRELAGLRARAATLGPMADEATLKLTVERYRLRQEALRKASARLLASASLADIARRAPENIRLLALNVEYPVEQQAKPGAPPQPGGQAQPGKAKPGAEPAAPQGTLLLEGVVVGERAGFDAALSRFVINLQASPMFQMPVVNESGLKELGTGEQVLHFVMHVGVK